MLFNLAKIHLNLYDSKILFSVLASALAFTSAHAGFFIDVGVGGERMKVGQDGIEFEIKETSPVGKIGLGADFILDSSIILGFGIDMLVKNTNKTEAFSGIDINFKNKSGAFFYGSLGYKINDKFDVYTKFGVVGEEGRIDVSNTRYSNNFYGFGGGMGGSYKISKNGKLYIEALMKNSTQSYKIDYGQALGFNTGILVKEVSFNMTSGSLNFGYKHYF